MVTGIVPKTVDVAAALRGAGIPLEPLTAITAEDASLTDTVVRPRNDILMGTTGTGTGVPGLTSTATEGLGPRPRTLPAHEQLRARLGELEIRDDEVENYLDALDAGRTVIGYAATETVAERVADVLRNAGVARVKVG